MTPTLRASSVAQPPAPLTTTPACKTSPVASLTPPTADPAFRIALTSPSMKVAPNETAFFLKAVSTARGDMVPSLGPKVPARQPGGEEAGDLEDAPGCFVTKRLDRPDSGVCYMPNALL